MPGFNFIEKQNTNQIEKFFQHKLKIFIQNTPTMMLKLKCFRENAGILYYDTWKNVFDLRIPYQNLLLKCFSNTEYAEASVEFAAFILDMPVFKAKLNGNSHYGMLFYQEFSTQLANLLENCIIDDKKVVYLIIFNLKMGDTIVDNEDPILKQILNIFEDINSILTGSELYKVFPKQLIKDLIFHIKRMDLYNNLNESQLYSVITQRLISNIKFTIIFENSYFISNSQTKSTQKSIFNILYNEYPQTFQKFKTKTIEEFLIKPTHINIDLGVATFLKKPDFPIVKKVNDFCLVFELDIVKILKTANKNATISNYDENYLMTVYLWELLQTKMKKKGTDEDMKILSPSLKSMARKIEDLEKEIMELRKYIEERKIETEKVDKNITEIKLKRGYLLEEINELTNKSIKLNQNLNGYLNEENIQKKLINTFVESVKTISNLQTKDYVSEVIIIIIYIYNKH